jgi:glycine/D-amino acid oxidase-like deaminating enzyme
MRLHSAYPFWMISEGLAHSYPTLRENLKTDVVIIGAGITGALVGHALCEAGLDVVLVDKRHVAHGSTAASTALLQYENDVPLFQLEQMYGTRKARRAYQLCSEALDRLGKLCATFAGDVGFEPHPSLLYATYKKHVPEILQPEYAARLAAGFDVRLLGEQEIAEQFGFRAPGALLSRQGAHVNPYRLTNHLLENISTMNGRIYELSAVAAIESSQRQVRVLMQDGNVVTAKYVVVAAGYEAESFLPRPVGTLHSSYALISKPLPQKQHWYRNALLWETHQPYHYFRTTADQRIIVGGRDEPFYSPEKRDALLRRKSGELLEDFLKLFPHIPFEPDFWWAGTFAETEDGLPYIGPCDHKRVLYALGYSGNGITFSTIAADLLCERILGRKHPDAELFGFDRTPGSGSHTTSRSAGQGLSLP